MEFQVRDREFSGTCLWDFHLCKSLVAGRWSMWRS